MPIDALSVKHSTNLTAAAPGTTITTKNQTKNKKTQKKVLSVRHFPFWDISLFSFFVVEASKQARMSEEGVRDVCCVRCVCEMCEMCEMFV